MVKHWITVASERCKKLTVRAVEDDAAIAITDEVKFSTSAVDVTGFLIQLGNFWKNMEWPEMIAAYGFASIMMEEISACAQFYVEKVAKRLNHQDIFDEQGKFRASEKVYSCLWLICSNVICALIVLILVMGSNVLHCQKNLHQRKSHEFDRPEQGCMLL